MNNKMSFSELKSRSEQSGSQRSPFKQNGKNKNSESRNELVRVVSVEEEQSENENG